MIESEQRSEVLQNGETASPPSPQPFCRIAAVLSSASPQRQQSVLQNTAATTAAAAPAVAAKAPRPSVEESVKAITAAYQGNRAMKKTAATCRKGKATKPQEKTVSTKAVAKGKATKQKGKTASKTSHLVATLAHVATRSQYLVRTSFPHTSMPSKVFTYGRGQEHRCEICIRKG